MLQHGIKVHNKKKNTKNKKLQIANDGNTYIKQS